jgi:hypothetical protein
MAAFTRQIIQWQNIPPLLPVTTQTQLCLPVGSSGATGLGQWVGAIQTGSLLAHYGTVYTGTRPAPLNIIDEGIWVFRAAGTNNHVALQVPTAPSMYLSYDRETLDLSNATVIAIRDYLFSINACDTEGNNLVELLGGLRKSHVAPEPWPNLY